VSNRPALPVNRRSQPKWHLVYYLLAGFDVLTVTTSLLMNHRLMDIYAMSVEVNQVWAKRLQTYSELAKSAGEANAPGNNVFNSRNVNLEKERLRDKSRRFQQQMTMIRQDLQLNVDNLTHKRDLLKKLDQIDAAMAQMLRAAQQIFSDFSQARPDRAGQRMATMDQKYADVNEALENLRQYVGQVQQQNLEQQKDQASLLKIYKYVITISILMMVTGITIYGYKLSQKMASDVHTKELLIAELQQNQELKQVLAELHQTQAQMVQSEKMSALGQMVAGVAHEINNPINFIQGNLAPIEQYTQDLLKLLHAYQQHYPHPPESLQAELARVDLDFLQEDMRKLLCSMNMGSDRICAIVQSLRNFSRLDEAAYKAVDIHEGIESTLMILQHRLHPTAQRPAIQVLKDYGQLPLVECYAGQLNQVFMNLLTNAIDALEEANQGRNHQEMAAHANTIWIQTGKRGENWVTITITDNGSGIPDAIQAKLFNPFFTSKPVGKGTGLGLSISYQIVTEKHGGKLWFDSTHGGDTKFIMEIPVRR
jgi:two-component system, NtrC family, sensor kinase